VKHHDQTQQNRLDNAANSLFDALLSLKDRDEISRFMADLCTPAELEAFVDRWRVAKLLEKDLSYREINDRTGVSVTTIGRVARFRELGAGGYRTALDRLQAK